MTGVSFLKDNGVKNPDGSTDYNIITQAPIPQLNNKNVQFAPNGRIFDTNGSYLGNWTPNGNNVDMNLNSISTGKKTIKLTGKN